MDSIADKVKLDEERHLIVIDGKYYMPHKDKDGKAALVEIDIKKHDKMIDKIVEKLIPAMDSEMLLRDALKDMLMADLKIIYDKLYVAKRKAKPKMKPGCVEMQIGSVVLPLRD